MLNANNCNSYLFLNAKISKSEIIKIKESVNIKSVPENMAPHHAHRE